MSHSAKRAQKGSGTASSSSGESPDSSTGRSPQGTGRRRPGRPARVDSAGPGPHSASDRKRPGRPEGLDPDETRNRILTVARDLFANRGFGDVGLREIGKEVGVNPATIHYHFGSKEELYRRVVEGAAGVMLERMTAAASGDRPAMERLADAIRTYGAVLSEHPYLPRILFRHALTEQVPLPEWFMKEYAAKVKVLLPGIFRDGIAGGEFRELDPRFMFITVMSLCFFFHLGFPVFRQVLGAVPQDPGDSTISGLSFASPSPELTREYSQHVIDLLLRGICAERT
jgi:TetR/AcrR family transcriptional regulator